MDSIIDHIDTSRVPKHVAIIMDGNGRWAQQQGKPRVFGHRSGVAPVRKASEAASKIGVDYLTLYAFSTENWARPIMEVNALMALLVDSLKKEMKNMHENKIRLRAIGDLDHLPRKSLKALRDGIEMTKDNTGLTLTLALNYSARSELTFAVQNIVRDAKSNDIDPSIIDEDYVSSYLYTNGMPDPELMIRTSGECRLSNFLLWQMAYTEFCFFDIYWPEFTEEHFYKAIIEYQNRDRRFGGVQPNEN